MNPRSNFQFAGGSMIGRDHRAVCKNNQDAWVIGDFDELTIAVVADGCGSGANSEVGAHLSVNLLVKELCQQFKINGEINWNHATRTIQSNIDILARNMKGSYRRVIENYFLFTLVGVVLDSEMATFFACGDGLLIVNGAENRLGPFEGNMPPYIGYGLLESELAINPNTVVLRPQITMPINDLDSFLIGTDGVDDFIDNQLVNVPGLDKKVGPIDQFWQDGRYFAGNPALINRQLKLIGRDWPIRDPNPGLLSDDTTIIVGRQNITP